MLKVLFRVDDGPGIGAGHLMRCLALAEAIHNQGGCLHLSTVRISALHTGWHAMNAQIHLQKCEIGSSDDLDQTLRHVHELEADWLVVDGYGFSTAWLDTAAAKCPVLCLDDLGNRDAAVQLILNQNPGSDLRHGATYRRCGCALLGLDWFLLRQAWREIQPAAEPHRMLLTLGGEDPNNRMIELMRALLADGRNFMADVISSAPEAGFRQAEEMSQSRPDRFVVHRGPVDLPALMRRVTVVVSGGGVTPIEAASLGVVPVIVILAENQTLGSEYLVAIGAARAVESGDGAMVSAARLTLDLLGDDVIRLTMAARGRALVDGRGPARVVAAMMEKRG